MKKLFLSLMTANFSGMLISVVIFLINTYRLELSEYFLYSYINSALIIAGSFVLFGTDNLALVSYDTHSSSLIYRSVKRIKRRMLILGVLIFFGSCIYFGFTNSAYAPSLITICCAFSIPFLLSFYNADTHYYIHKEVYNKYIRLTIYARLICLIPIMIAAFFQQYLLLTTLLANSMATILPPIIFNRKNRPVEEARREEKVTVFPAVRLFENFILNSFPVLYINAVFFLFNAVNAVFVKSSIVVYTSRIYIILAGILSGVVSVLISSHLKKTMRFIERFGRYLWLIPVILLAAPLVLKFAISIDYEFKFILWSSLELASITCFLVLFFIKIYQGERNPKLVLQLFLITALFFVYTKLTTFSLEDLMLKRGLFNCVLVLIVFPFSGIKKKSADAIQ
ncbi:MAG: hypothetical protein ABW007_13205 [Chitinophagaceae bacterium]